MDAATHAAAPPHGSTPTPHPGPFERELVRGFLQERRATEAAERERAAARKAEAEAAEADTAAEDDRDVLSGGSADARREALRALAGWRPAPTWRSPMLVATGLRFARALDAAPGLVDALWTGAPRVIVDVPDPLALALLRGAWAGLVYGEDARVETINRALSPADAERADALVLAATEPTRSRDRDEEERGFLQILQVAKPILCLSPDAATTLPAAALRAAEYRLRLPPLDAGVIARTIRIVTGRPCRAGERARLAGLTPETADLAVAIRADRRPGACVAELARLGAAETATTGRGRDLALDQLHGAREAVAWARGALADLAAWRAGGPWSDVSSGVLLAGPPGCGKTLLASVMAHEGNLPLVTGSLGRWQSEDGAHLGTTLRAMRRAFEEAKLRATSGPGGRTGAVLLIDEVDSFPDRSKLTHEHRDYTIEIVNALLEQLDGAVGREGVICIATTNDAGRCDPALLRPGRLHPTIPIGHPDLDERVAMLRVRLGEDLPDTDLLPVARLTERATGAGIEALVADARRRARHAGRPLAMADLVAVAGAADAVCPPEVLRRTAIHEAGHALVAALEVGPERLVVALQRRDGVAGWLDLTGVEQAAGTRTEIEGGLRVLLAGRAAEELVLGAPSAGARQDLASATALAANLLGVWGLGRRRLLSPGRMGADALLADPALRAEAAELLDDLYAEVTAILRRHRPALLAIADRLLAERRLDGPALVAMIGAPASRGARRGGGATHARADDHSEDAAETARPGRPA